MRLLLGTLAAFFTSAVCAAPFQNGDFQASYTQPLTLHAGDNRMPGWEIGGDGSVVWHDGAVRFPGPAPKSEWIQQTFDTKPGHNYRINYGLFRYGDGGGPSAIKTTVTSSTGEVLKSETHWIGNITGTVGYARITVEFTAATTSTTLRFTHEYAEGATREARIDDVQLLNLSEGGTLSVGLFPGIYMSGQVGLMYELQYSNPGQPSTWESAGTFYLDASPKLVLVETNSANLQRTYRSVLVP